MAAGLAGFLARTVPSRYRVGPTTSTVPCPERAKSSNPDKPEVYLQIHKLASYEIVAQVLAECRAQDVEVNLVSRPLTRNPT